MSSEFTLSQEQVDELVVSIAHALDLSDVPASGLLANVPSDRRLELIARWKDEIAQREVTNVSDVLGAFRPVYELIAGFITKGGNASGTQPVPNVDKSAWTFIRAAANVNQGQTLDAFTARQYTTVEYNLRMPGNPLMTKPVTPSLITQMSNGIGFSIAQAIVKSATIPTINQIGGDDARTVVDGYFKGDTGGWVGNALFQYFATGQFFKQALIGSDLPNGTYDIIASMYAMQQTLESASFPDLVRFLFSDLDPFNESGRAFTMAHNSLGTSGTENLFGELSKDLDAYMAANYYQNWSGQFNTFYNPSDFGPNPLLTDVTLQVGTLHQAESITTVAQDKLIVRMGDGDDQVTIGVLPQQGLVDGGKGNNALNLSEITQGMVIASQPIIAGNQAIKISGKIIGSTYAYNFQSLTLNNSNDYIKLSGADVPSLQTLNTGGGNDTVDSTVPNLKVTFGDGNDTLVAGGSGSVVNAGTGHDVFYVGNSNNVLISGAKTTDTFSLFGVWTLTGASGWIGQQDPWTTNPLDGVSYGIDPAGELQIKVGDSIMFVAGYAAQQSLVPDQNIGGIELNDRSFSSSLLLKLPKGIPWLQTQFQFVNAEARADLGQAIYNGVDPLVFDLSGAGINLTAQSGASPMLDMNSNGFSVHSGWIEPGEGVLVLDKNGSGQIESADEMFGGAGQNAFAQLAKYDSNLDGVIDAQDPIYSQLRIWVDSNDNGIVDPGELLTLQQAGIASINLGAAAQSGDFIAGNQVLATGSFTRTDGSTGAVDAVSFATDNFDSQFRGSTAVSAAAAALPNLKGYGTLTDLQVAMTNDPALSNPSLGPSLMSVVQATMPTVTALDLTDLRNEVMPILTAWANAVQGIDDNGNPIPIPTTAHADVPILVSDNSGGNGTPSGVDTSLTLNVTDFAYEVTDGQGSYWKLASGSAVLDANGNAIARPTLDQVMAQTPSGAQWMTFSGAELDFLQRYLGNPIEVGAVAPQDPAAALSNISATLNAFTETLDQIAVRLAMQGPLAPYFAGISYSAATDKFTPTTDQQLTPMYEAIFRAAPQDAAGAASWLGEWRQIVDVMLGDFQESAGSGISLTYGYEFASMVRAYETVGLPLDIVSAAQALGVPAGTIFMGGATVTGNNSGDIFYLSTGDQTVIGGTGGDNFVLGGHFGHDVIYDDQPFGGPRNPTDLYLTSIKPTDVMAVRNGNDLILDDTLTGQQVTITNEFIGIHPALIFGNTNDVWGVNEIIFSDGTVWNKDDMAAAVAPNTNGVDGTLLGTSSNDVLNGGNGNHFMSGGDGGDTYLYGRGDGNDTIFDGSGNPFNLAPNIVQFGAGISQSDLTLTRNGNSQDLLITINGDPSDSLLIQGQFFADFTGVFGTQFFDQMQAFSFADGSFFTYQDIENQLLAQAEATPGAAIYGFDGVDQTLDPGLGGNRFMSGGNNDDTYIFGLGYGNDTIQGGHTNILTGKNQTVLFNPGVDPSQVHVIRNGDSNDATLVLSDGSTLLLVNQFDAIFTGSFGVQYLDRIETFQFQDAARTVWTASDLMNKALAYEETNGGHTIFGFAAFDQTIDPGPGGNFFLSGGNNSDTYVFGLGYGNDTIKGGHNNILSSGNGNPSDIGSNLSSVTAVRDPSTGSLTLTLADGGTLVVQGQLVDGNDTLVSSDATAPSTGQVVSPFGSSDATLVLSDGGMVTFSAQAISGGGQTVLFGQGVDPSQVQVVRNGDSGDVTFVLSDGSALTVENQFVNAGAFNIWLDRIDNFQFQDAAGTRWSVDDVMNKAIAAQEAVPGGAIYGFQRGDTIDPGLGGNHFMSGEGGPDVYIFGQGYGNDTIFENGGVLASSGTEVLFNADVDPSTVRLERVGASNDLEIFLADGSELDIEGQFDPTATFGPHFNNRIWTFQFQDAAKTAWTYLDVEQKLIAQEEAVAGGTVYDFAFGNNLSPGGGNTLDGFAGNETLVGAEGSFTTFVFGLGYGQEVVDGGSATDPFLANFDILRFGQGISASALSLTLSGNDLVIGVAGPSTSAQGSDTVTIKNEIAGISGNLGPNPVSEFDFADGTTWNLATIEHAIVASEEASGSHTIGGFATDDTLDGFAGNDYLQGNGGNDTYIFGSGYGQEIINNFHSDNGQSVLRINAGTTPDQVTMSKVGENLVLSIAGTTDQAVILNYFVSSEDQIAQIQFADGTIWDQATIGAQFVIGATGNDTLIGGAGGSTLDGLGGTDTTLIGGGGAATYVFGRGYGEDTIFDPLSGAGSYDDSQARLLFNADTTPADVVVKSDAAGDLILAIAGTSDAITVQNYFNGSAFALAQIQFADGTSWSYQTVFNKLHLTGTPGADTLIGGAGNETFDGKGGNDTLIGGGGNDTFIFNAGYGQLDIQEQDTSQAPDNVLELGTGLSESNLTVTSDGSALFLAFGSSGDRIQLDGMFANAQDGVQAVEFADGTVLTRQQLITLEMTGTSGADVIFGTPGADTIDGKGGSDTVIGGGGNDTFIFNSGYGQLEINELDLNPAARNVLQLGPGITPASIVITSDGNNVFLTIGSNGDRIQLDGMLANAQDGVQAIQFADGTTWTRQQIVAGEIVGGNGNNTLIGTTGADVFDGKGGRDYEQGNGGNDTFIFNPGYQYLEVNEADSNPLADNVLRLGAGIAASALTVTNDAAGDIFLDVGTSPLGGVSGFGGGTVNSNFATGPRISADNSALTLTNGGTGETGSWFSNSKYAITGFSASFDYQATGPAGAVADGMAFVLQDAPAGTTALGTGGGGLGYGGISPSAAIEFNIFSGHTQGTNFATDGSTGTYNSTGSVAFWNGDKIQVILSYNGSVLTENLTDLANGATYTASYTTNLASVLGSGTAYVGFTGGDGGETSTQVVSNFSFAPGIGDQVKLDGEFANPQDGVQAVQFADGTTLTRAELIARAMAGTPGSDTIFGTTGADVIDGKGGNDYVQGNGGNDTFVFNPGYGQLEINEVDANPTADNVLSLGTGILASATSVTADAAGDILVTPGEVISGFAAGTVNSGFATGPRISADDSAITLTDGGDGEEGSWFSSRKYSTNAFTASFTYQATGSADGAAFVLEDAPAGAGALGGGGGGLGYSGISPSAAVEFDMFGGSGTNFATNGKTGTYNSTGQVSFGNGDKVQVTLSYNGSVLTENLTDLNNGATYSASYMTNLASVLGSGSAYVGFTGGTGGLASTQVVSNFTFTSGSSEQIKLDGAFTNPEDGVQTVQFADGTTWTRSQLVAMAAASSGDPFATSPQVIDSHGTAQLEQSTGSNDTFLFNPGYGLLEIDEKTSDPEAANVLAFGAGIVPSAVAVTADAAGNFYLTVAGTGDRVQLDNMFSDAGSGVQSVSFADGTVWTRQHLFALETTGTTGNDRIYGTTGSDVIDGKGAPSTSAQGDTAIGNGGNDTFIFNPGYGQLEIDEVDSSPNAANVLQLGQGILPSAVSVTYDGRGGFYLSVAGSSTSAQGDRIDLTGMFTDARDGVQAVKFADGTVWTRQQLFDMELAGTTGNDTIFGTTGADVIDGKGGNDTAIGNGGNDTFIFNPGYGQLEIDEVDTNPAADNVLVLGTGISAASVSVTSDAKGDFILNPGTGTGDRILLDGMAASTEDGVQEIRFADGTVWHYQDVVNRFNDPSTDGTDQTLVASPSGPDILSSSGSHNTLIAQSGADTLLTSGEDDLLLAGSGPDTLVSSGQSNTLVAGSGLATLLSTGVDDTLIGNGGGDTLNGVGGTAVMAAYATANVTVDLATGEAAINGSTSTADTLLGITLAGAFGTQETLIGGSGVDTLVSGAGGNTLIAGSGRTTAAYMLDDVAVDLGAGSAGVNGASVHDTLIGITAAAAFGQNDTLIGSSAADTLFGDARSGTLVGGTAAYLFDDMTVDLGGGTATALGTASTGDTLIAIMAASVGGADDTLIAVSGADTLSATGAGDVLLAGSGADILSSSGVGNTLVAGTGLDTLISTGSGDTLLGSGLGSTLIGSGGTGVTAGYAADNVTVNLAAGTAGVNGATTSDTLIGITAAAAFGRSDTLIAAGAADTLMGDAAGSTLVGGYAAYFLDNVTVDLGAGRASIDGSASDTLVGVTAATVAGSSDTLIAGSGPETLFSSGSGNTLIAGAGADLLSASGSSDLLIAGSGADVLSSSGSANTLVAGSGADTLSSTGSGDTLIGNGGGATLIGSAGSDAIASYGLDNVIVNLAAGTASVSGSATADTLIGITVATASGSNDTLVAASVADTLVGTAAGDTLIGGYAAYRVDSATVDLGAGLATVAGGSTADTLIGITAATVAGNADILLAGSTADTLFAEGSSDTLLAGAGADTLVSGGSSNTLIAGAAADTLVSRGSGDTLIGNAAGSTLEGTAGGDVVAAYGLNNVTVNLDTGTAGVNGATVRDKLLGIAAATAFGQNDTLIGGSGATTLIGNADGNTLIAGTGGTAAAYGLDNVAVDLGAGTASVNGTTGFDTLLGISAVEVSGAGDTVVAGSGSATLSADGSSDTLLAGSGSDTLLSTGSSNLLLAGSGADLLSSIGSGDTLIGGAVSDTLSSSGSGNTLVAGSGAALLVSSGSDDTLVGNIGADTLSSSGSANTLVAGSGSDTLSSSGSGDTLLGGAGSDTLSSTGSGNTLVAGAGPDALSSSGSGDTLIGNADGSTLESSAGSGIIAGYALNNVAVDLPTGTASIGGSSVSDTLLGITLAAAYGQNDTLIAAGNADTLIGDADGSTLTGGYAAYLLDAVTVNLAAGTAALNGTSPSTSAQGDTLIGITAATVAGNGDTLLAGGGAETLFASGSGDTLTAGAGTDTLVSAGSSNVLIAGTAVDTLSSSGSGDTLVGNAAGSTLGGTAGFGVVAGYGLDNVTVNLATGTAAVNGASVGDTLLGIGTAAAFGQGDTLIGSSAATTLIGDASGNTLIAGTGATTAAYALDNVTVDLGAERASVNGSSAADTLIGIRAASVFGSNDTLLAGSGPEVLSSGGSNNTLIADSAVDTLTSSGTGDTLIGNAAGSTLDGSNGIGTVAAYGLDNIIVNLAAGSAGVNGATAGDTLTGITAAAVSGANDTLIGDANGDTLGASGSNNTVIGGAGDDTFLVNGGTDTFVGGGGSDSFAVLSAATTAGLSQPQNLIEGFDPVNDVIDLTHLGALTSFADIGFSTVTFGSASYLQLSLGSGQALTLAGVTSDQLSAGNFLFHPVTAPTLSVEAASGEAATAIALDISSALVDVGTNESLSVNIAGLPTGATLSAGTQNSDGSWTLTAAQLAGLTLTTPFTTFGDFSLAVTATAAALDGVTQASTGGTIDLSVEGRPQPPVLAVENATGNPGTAIPLAITTALLDHDRPETLSLTITGLPAGTTLSAGTQNADGSWTLTPAQLPGLTLTAPAGTNGLFEPIVTSTATLTTDGLQAQSSANFALIVGIANLVLSTSGTGVVLQGGPGNDTLTVSGTRDTAFGGGGNDTLIVAGGSDDLLVDGGGQSTLLSSGTSDTLIGVSGVDTLLSSGTGDTLVGNAAGDTLISTGTRTVAFYDISNATIDLATGTADVNGAGPGDTLIGIGAAVAAGTNDTVIAGSGAETLVAGGQDDTLIAGAGADALIALGSADTLIGNAEGSVLNGSGGTNAVAAYAANNVTVNLVAGTASANGSTVADTLIGFTAIAGYGSADTLIGASSGDVLSAGGSEDVAIAGSGAETLSSSGIDNTLIAGTGADTLTSSGQGDTLVGNAAGSTLAGAAAASGAVAAYTAAEVTVDLATGTASVAGSSNADILTGIAAVAAYGAADTLIGASSGDVLTAAGSADVAIAGSGAQTLSSSGIGNTLIAGVNADTLATSGQGDTLAGNAEGSTLIATGTQAVAFYAAGNLAVDLATGTAVVNGASVFDTLSGFVEAAVAGADDTVIAGGGGDTLTAAGSSDTLLAGAGPETLASNAAGNTLIAGTGHTVAFYGASGVTVNLVTQTAAVNGAPSGDTLTGITAAAGAGDADTLIADGGTDTLSALGSGDTLLGGSGTSTLNSNAGGNTLIAGTGLTIASYGGAGVTVNLASGTAAVNGSAVSDALFGIAQALVFGAGDTVIAGAGTDLLTAKGTGDTLLAGSGSDTLIAGGTAAAAQANVLEGGTGGATLVGNAGGNTLIAGSGHTVAFYSGGNLDINLGAGTAVKSGTTTSDTLIGITTLDLSGSNDTLVAGSQDLLQVMSGGRDTLVSTVAGNTLIGAAGASLADYVGSGIAVSLVTGTATNGSASDVISGITRVTVAGSSDTAIADGGTDTLSASGANDTLIGGSGTTTLIGAAAGDTLIAGSGRSIASYDVGNAAISLAAGTAAVNGAAGGDTLIGITHLVVSGSGDTAIADGGTDTLTAAGSGETLIGGSGTTTLVSNAAGNTLEAGSGSTEVYYGIANATINLATGTAAVNGSSPSTSAQGDMLVGITNVEVSTGNDTLIAGAGTDVLAGKGTGDTLIGGSGTDTLIAVNNPDLLEGGSGAATLVGSADGDTLVAGTGQTTAFYSGGGLDIDLSSGSALEAGEISGDTLIGIATVDLSGSNDTLVAASQDLLQVVSGGHNTLVSTVAGNTLIGGSGASLADYVGSGIAVNLAAGIATGGSAAADTLINLTRVALTGSNDTAIADGGTDTLVAAGNGDTLLGGTGTVTLASNAGGNTLVSGSGRAVASYATSNATINLATGTAGINGASASDTLVGITNLVATGNADTLIGGSGTDTLTGTGSGDTLIGGSGTTTLVGNAGGNTLEAGTGSTLAYYGVAGATINLAAGTAAVNGATVEDVLVGIANVTVSTGNDTVIAGTGPAVLIAKGQGDTLIAGSGTDTLIAGGSGDVIEGGAGTTTLVGNIAGDTLIAGSGRTTAFYTGGNLSLNLSAGTAVQAGTSPGDTLIGIANLSVSGGNDTLVAGTGDSLTAAGGSDTLIAGSGGGDLLQIASGSNDTLVSTVGGNTLLGSGSSLADYVGSGIAVSLASGSATEGSSSDSLSAITRVNVIGSSDTVIGDGGTDTLFASGSSDTLIGGSGTATLIGSVGGDTLEAGSGRAIASYAAAGLVANLAAGTAAVNGGSSSDALVGITNVTASGANSTLIAGSDTDSLTASGTASTLIAGAGTDHLSDTGTGGAYDFASGDGNATINNGASGNGGPSNSLNFGSGLSDENLWFLQSGNNLQIDLMGTKTHVTIDNWFSGSTDQLQEITAGGLEIDSQVSQLVQAMATYAADNPSFNPTTATQAPNDPTLQNAIAAAWHH
jgi:Ca2+-binding RTX toxin-like protein